MQELSSGITGLVRDSTKNHHMQLVHCLLHTYVRQYRKVLNNFLRPTYWHLRGLYNLFSRSAFFYLLMFFPYILVRYFSFVLKKKIYELETVIFS